MHEYRRTFLESEIGALGILKEQKEEEIAELDQRIDEYKNLLSEDPVEVTEEVEEIEVEVEVEEEEAAEETVVEEETEVVEEAVEETVEETEEEEVAEPTDYSKFSRDGLKAELDKREIDYKGNASNDSLASLLEEDDKS